MSSIQKTICPRLEFLLAENKMLRKKIKEKQISIKNLEDLITTTTTRTTTTTTTTTKNS